MTFLTSHQGLYTDYYELTMAQGYYLNGWQNKQATFDYFFRKIPFKGGYVIFAGLGDLLDSIEAFTFSKEDCDYLNSLGFKEEFTDYLEHEFKFSADIYSVEEGEVVFPQETVLRVEGNIIETQIVETLILNILNFESLIATKAARIRQVAGDKIFIDFGLRRAQGLGGIHASKAAIVGGADSTSNVYSAREFGLQASGTQAHSWIESFEDELEAFRAFVKSFPDNSILLVDTYDTLKSGVPNAIKVAKEMEERDEKLKGIRLDSGDLAYLSKKARKMLDEAGLDYVKITASNQLDEYLIKSLHDQNAPIDGFGVGTSLITGQDDAALDGVYKLSSFDGEPRLKISENIEKVLLPGRKKVIRLSDQNGMFRADAIGMFEEENIDMIFHPFYPEKSTPVNKYEGEALHQKVMEKGEKIKDPKSPRQITEYFRKRFEKLPEEHKRFENPHVYKVGISKKLMDERNRLIRKMKDKME